MLYGCATIDEAYDELFGSDEPQLPQVTHFTMRQGTMIKYPAPYPVLTPVFVQFHYDNGNVVEKLAFRGWDFNHDRRFDMLEVMAVDEKVHKIMYDFNLDGSVDMERLRQAPPVQW